MALAFWSATVPKPHEVRTNQIATIVAADGSTVLAQVIPPAGNRTPVPLSDIPQPVRDAVLSAEDRNFWTNSGFSTQAYLRAARDNLLGRDDAGGGSTITQQYVKNAFLGSDRTLSRKMRELIISAKMGRQWSKDDILAAYLNTIYYGRGAYGIAAAADAYFAKQVPELTLAEGAVLAALVRAPSLLAPETNADALRERWNYVLDGMVTMHTLPAAQRAGIEFPTIVAAHPVADAATHGPTGLIRTQVLSELQDAGISRHDIDTRAVRIVTTLDPRAQQAGLDAMHRALGGQPPQLRGAVVAVDPRSGAVRTYYGGEDGVGFDYAQAALQTGSAFKTFAVIAALEQGIPLSYQLDSSPLAVDDATITNVGNQSCGVCSLAQAFQRSLNTSFYRLAQTIGPQAVADAAHRAGIPQQIPGVPGSSLSEDGGAPALAIVLGAYSVRPLDMASAYATLAASGVYHRPYFVQQVIAGDGKVLLDRGAHRPRGAKGALPAGQQRISRAVADTTTQAMLTIPGLSNGHALADRPAAAKTGTTQLADTGANKDAWMVGFTPSLSTAVWIGSEQSQPLRTAGGAAIWGATLPADVWKQTMDAALDGTPAEQFPTATQPPGAGPFWTPPAAPAPRGPADFSPTEHAPTPVIIIPPAPEPTVPANPGPAPMPTDIFPGIGVVPGTH